MTLAVSPAGSSAKSAAFPGALPEKFAVCLEVPAEFVSPAVYPEATSGFVPALEVWLVRSVFVLVFVPA